MSHNFSSAPLGSHISKKTAKSKVVESILTSFAVIFMLSPVVVMMTWFGQFIDLNGAGNLAQDVTHAVFGSRGQ